MAVEKNNIEIVKLLLTNDKLDINIINISMKCFFLIKFKMICFSGIQNRIFQLHSKHKFLKMKLLLNISMIFF